jgi:hypothetical protein
MEKITTIYVMVRINSRSRPGGSRKASAIERAPLRPPQVAM